MVLFIMTKVVIFLETSRLLLNGEAQAGVEVDVPGLVLEVVIDAATVIEVVTGGRLNVDAQFLRQFKLQSGTKQCRELHAILLDIVVACFGRFLDSRLDVEVGLYTADGIDTETLVVPE